MKKISRSILQLLHFIRPFVCFGLLAFWLGVSTGAETRNVLLICVDDLRPDLNCYGVEHIQSPHIDQLAAEGRVFTRHYVQAPTCGASRCALLTGTYGAAGNDALFKRAKQIKAGRQIHPSMPAWFRKYGYTTVSVGKVSHHPGGRGGANWDEDSQLEMPEAWDRCLKPAGQWQHPRGWMHGLANGEIRTSPAAMDVYQSVPGDDSIYPDGLTTKAALQQLDLLTKDKAQPFFLAVGILRPHLPFGAPAQYLDNYRTSKLPPISHPDKPPGRTTWHPSSEFMKYNRWNRNPNTDVEFANDVRRHYAACVSFADRQVGKLIDRLKENGAWENTIVIVWGDHGWHLGEHGIWGKHSLFEESLRSPLIVRSSNLRDPGKKTEAIVESIDLFPTLCELTGLPIPGFVDGVSLVPNLDSVNAKGHDAISYTHQARSIRTESNRLIQHHDGFVELYDHIAGDGESENIGHRHPELVSRLQRALDQRLPHPRKPN